MLGASTTRSSRGAVRHRLRLVVPWALGLALVAWLLHDIPVDGLRDAFNRGPVGRLSFFAAFQVLITFAVDVWATRVGLSALGIQTARLDLVWARGASYLIGLVNFTLGQSTIALHLVKRGVRSSVAAGAAIHQIAVNALVLTTVTAAAVSLHPPIGSSLRATLPLMVLVTTAIGVGLWSAKPAWLVKWPATRWFFDHGLVAHGRAVASRLAHQITFATLYWVALRIWGVEIPLGEALAVIALLMFLAALPITPYGLGTVQTAQVFLLSAYADAPTSRDRAATILAFSLVQCAASILTQAGLGALCWSRWTRGHEGRDIAGPLP